MRMIDDSAFATAVAQADLPGAVGLIVDRDGLRYARSFGLGNVETGLPLDPQTPCQIASMTKALVSVAAMQLVERERLSLDAPIGAVLPELADPQVLAGFDGEGQPLTRPAVRPITLRHLLTHTAGFGYFFASPDLARYFAAVRPAPGSLASIRLPLLFDPGERWEYGVATDWVGQAIEAVSGMTLGDYLAEYLFAPLGMTATGFLPRLPPQAARVHARRPEGGFKVLPTFFGGDEFDAGGGGLTGSAEDYGRFIRMILRGGELDGVRVLGEATIREMARNQVGPMRAGAFGSVMPQLTAAFDPLPDQHTGWGLGFLLNPETAPNGRAPGSLAWAGIFNSYYWIDSASGLGGVFMAQLSPFADPGALAAFGSLERMAYDGG
jgi:CubicO group peptidase (beta-lactamase class C family)